MGRRTIRPFAIQVHALELLTQRVIRSGKPRIKDVQPAVAVCLADVCRQQAPRVVDVLVTPYACNGTMPGLTFTPDPSVKMTWPFCHASYSRFHSFSRRKPLFRSRCSGIHPVNA